MFFLGNNDLVIQAEYKNKGIRQNYGHIELKQSLKSSFDTMIHFDSKSVSFYNGLVSEKNNHIYTNIIILRIIQILIIRTKICVYVCV